LGIYEGLTGVAHYALPRPALTSLFSPLSQSPLAQPPTGRVLIQVVAEGWKTYGHWYDLTDSKQVVKIHLDRPPKWY